MAERNLRFGSVCSGIEAASVAWRGIGWRAAWVSEIEPFPCAVLAHHYPDVPNLGDMTTITKRVLTGEVEAPDVFCGGTPCQAFSVAGLRESLADERGNLSLKFVEIADAIDHVRERDGRAASIIFWENVPGVLSTKDNAFGCFLAGLAGEDVPLVAPGGKWANAGCVYGPARAVAWRTLDAQYFGLAQRRRRVFVVASARADFDPATVLFEWAAGGRQDQSPEQGQKRLPGAVDGCTLFRFRRTDSYAVSGSTSTLTARDCKDARDLVVGIDGRVRRLTVLEYERLQGFSDGYTAVPWRGKGANDCSDGVRYKALGNSWAVTVVKWLGERINKALEG